MVFLTLCATILQTFRNIEQKKLGQKLDLLSASWSRFILPFPIAILAVILALARQKKSSLRLSLRKHD